EARDERHEIGQEQARALGFDDRHPGEAARPEARPVALLGALADHVAAHVAARALDAAVGLAVGAHLLRQLAYDVVLGVLVDLLEALAEDLGALPALLHAHREAIPAIADGAVLALADRHVELELGIDRVLVLLAEVPGHAGGAEVGTDEAPVDGLL